MPAREARMGDQPNSTSENGASAPQRGGQHSGIGSPEAETALHWAASSDDVEAARR